MASYAVWVLGVGETKHVTNALRFASEAAAAAWGDDLLCRWMGAKSFEVRPSADPVNYPREEKP